MPLLGMLHVGVLGVYLHWLAVQVEYAVADGCLLESHLCPYGVAGISLLVHEQEAQGVEPWSLGTPCLGVCHVLFHLYALLSGFPYAQGAAFRLGYQPSVGMEQLGFHAVVGFFLV